VSEPWETSQSWNAILKQAQMIVRRIMEGNWGRLLEKLVGERGGEPQRWNGVGVANARTRSQNRRHCH
jgi:hypothetical protein